MKAKTISKVSKVSIAIALVGMFSLKWANVFPNATATDIIGCCLAAYGIVAGTIDLNISLDKIVDIVGGKHGSTGHSRAAASDN